MKMIRPVTVTDAVLSSSNIPETDFAAWSSATTYALGDKVISTTTHRIYQSLQAGNLNHVVSDTAWWQDIGPTNRWAMFDQVVGTVTTGASGVTVELLPGSIDAVAVVDTNAETVRVRMTQGSTVVYDQTKTTNIGGAPIIDWYTYFFEPVGKVTMLTFFDLPTYPSAKTKVEAIGTGVTVGTLIVGREMGIGSTEAGPQIGIDDFSRKERDEFGNFVVVPRAFAKRMTVRSMVEDGQPVVDAIQRELAKYRATPVLWIGEEGWDSLTIYGFYKEFSLDLTMNHIAYCSLTIEGLT
jgi:hypothetical protein